MGWRAPGSGHARKEEGRPEGRPIEFARTLFRASLARDAELGMRNGDVLGPALERRIFRAVEPLERELAGVDPLDGGEPEALELALLVPIGGQHPRADPKRFSSGRAVRLVDRRRSRGCTRAGPGEIAPAAPMFVFCSDTGLVVVAAAFSGLDGSGAPAPLRTCSSIRR